jgi:signal transduction histidine kinase
MLCFTVRDSGDGADMSQIDLQGGTGLRRLRERLAALYGDRAGLHLSSRQPAGFSATLVIPRVEHAT